MEYLQEVVDSGLTSDLVTRFEQAFAEAHGAAHCIATPGCTPALAVLAAAFGFEPGDEIVVSSVSDYGTVQGLISAGYIPVFADTAPGTVIVDAETVEACISERTRAILVVHLTGLICDMDGIGEVAARHGLVVYEDACQAVFGRYKGRWAGTLATAGAFSFDSEKTMGSDVGGCILTDDDGLAERARFVGQSRGGEMVEHFGRVHTVNGFAHRMTQSTAAISLAQLEVIRPQVEHRDRMIRLLSALLDEIPGVTALPIPPETEVYSCWMAGFTIDPERFRCSTEEFGDRVAAAGIPGAGQARYYLLPAALPYLTEGGRETQLPLLAAAGVADLPLRRDPPVPTRRPCWSASSAGAASARSTSRATASRRRRSCAASPRSAGDERGRSAARGPLLPGPAGRPSGIRAGHPVAAGGADGPGGHALLEHRLPRRPARGRGLLRRHGLAPVDGGSRAHHGGGDSPGHGRGPLHRPGGLSRGERLDGPPVSPHRVAAPGRAGLRAPVPPGDARTGSRRRLHERSPLAQMRRAEVVSPLGDEPLVFYTDVLDEYLRSRGVETLIYMGFAADMCLLGAEGGARAMLARGYRCVVMRDATVGVETPESFPRRLSTNYALHIFEWSLGFGCTSAQFREAVDRVRGETS